MRKSVSVCAAIVFATVVLIGSHSDAANQALLAKVRPLTKLPNASQATTIWTVQGLCSSYNFPTKLTGGGVIGIAEFGGGFLQSDLNLFSSTYMNGTPITVQVISVDGSTNSPGFDLDSDMEVTLDIEIAAAAYYFCTGKAPTIKVFFASNFETYDELAENFATTITAASTAGCDVLSISWGLPENYISSNTLATNIDNAAAAAAAKGMVTLASSGDGDSNDAAQGEFDGRNHTLLPTSCPHIVSVGGTSKTPTTEVVWNNGLALGTGEPSGTGGGYSTIFPAQSWQVGAPIAKSTNNGKGRMIPDVSANADPFTGYTIIFEGSVTTGIGGTSCSSPLWAGLVASWGKKLGFITPTLWLAKNRSAFVDIVSGNNGLFTATVGPDPASGIGIPSATVLSKIFLPVPIIPPTPSTVTASFNSSTGTLSLVGDSNANSLTITYLAGSITVEGANATTIAVTGVGGTAPKATSQKFTVGTAPINIASSLGAGNDSIAFVNVNANNVNMTLGSGVNSVAFSLCQVKSLTTVGWRSTDKLLTASTKITSESLK